MLTLPESYWRDMWVGWRNTEGGRIRLLKLDNESVGFTELPTLTYIRRFMVVFSFKSKEGK